MGDSSVRKDKLALMVLILLISFNSIAHANSGPTYWSGYPGIDVLAVEENSPIVVESEELQFNFMGDGFKDYIDYSLGCLVTARYLMSNPTDKMETVQMAFPFISTLKDFNTNDIIIREDPVSIPYTVYIGDVIKSKGRKAVETGDDKLKFDNIVYSITTQVYTPKNYNLDEVGTLYTYDIKTKEDKINIAIEYTVDYEKTKVISKGFNGFQGNGNEVKEIARIYDNEILELFVIGEDLDLNINCYSDGELTKKTDKYSYDLTIEKISVRDYISKEVEAYKDKVTYNDYLAKNQLFNLWAKTLDELIEKDVMNLWADEFYALDYQERIFVLLYEIEILPQSSKFTSVSYVAKGTMDRTETKEPLYTFEYLLNPANKWADFKDLNIEIIPPKEHPYIVESSIHLTRNEDGVYTGKFSSLPKEDLSFTLYSKEKVTFLDKVEREISNLSYIHPIEIGILILLIIPFIGLKSKLNRKS